MRNQDPFKKDPSNHSYFQIITSEQISQEMKGLWPQSQDWTSFYNQTQTVFERVLISNDAEGLIALARRLVDVYDHFPESTHLNQEIIKLMAEGRNSINLTRKQDRELTRISKQIIP